MKKPCKVIHYLLLILLISCGENNIKKISIDFIEKDTAISTNKTDSNNSLKVAISAMISPEPTYVIYKDMLDYISKKINKNIILVQRKTYLEINSLLENGEIDFAFICSGAYVELSSNCQTEIIAVPQVNGKSFYQAYIIANINSNVNKFEDLMNKSFAYTDLLSNTGRFYALKKLKEIGKTDKEFFSKIIFSNAHDNSIQLVNNGIVDAATVDGLIFDFLKIKKPDLVKNITILEKSELYGIPPIVSKYDKKQKLDELRNVLLNMADDKKGKEILSKLLIDTFVPGYDSIYNSIRKIYHLIRK